MGLATFPKDRNSILLLGGVSPDGKTKSSVVYRLEVGCCEKLDNELFDSKDSVCPDYFLDN